MKAWPEAYRSLLGGGGWQGGSGEGGAKHMSSDRACPTSLCFAEAQRTDLYRTLQRLEASQLHSEVLLLFHCQTPLVFKELPF